MADADDKKEQEEQKAPETEAEQTDQNDKKSLVARLLPWIIMAVVVAICAGGGFSLGRLFAGSDTPEAAESDSKSDEPTQAKGLKADDDSANDSGKAWYYDFEPIVANLKEPNLTRYVSLTLTFEMSSGISQPKGRAFLDDKKPILTNWLCVYLSSLSLDDITGDKNLKKLQSHILESLNEELFPDSKAQIQQVLIKGFAVQ
jgi:flagellar basal body-associated protein FliL